MILTLRTDNPEAEITLYDNGRLVEQMTWLAHRQLAETIHIRITELLGRQGQALQSLTGLVVYKGPGSFTGLRIGIATANALSYALQVPVVAITGEEWQVQGIDALEQGLNEGVAVPEYGALPHITAPKH